MFQFVKAIMDLPLYKQGQALRAMIMAMQAEAMQPVPEDTSRIKYGRPVSLIKVLAQMNDLAKEVELMG